jgi:ubiquinone/menaquinone biosynthesis C-methylase UbiE
MRLASILRRRERNVTRSGPGVHCPGCRSVCTAELLGFGQEFVCACGWRKPAGAVPAFALRDTSEEAAYFRDDFHARWKHEQALIDADAQHDRYRRICLDKVLRALPSPDARVLDVGCGLGHFLRALPPTVDAHALDLSHGNLEFLRASWRAGDVDARVWQASADALPFEDEQFDVVYAFSMFWYLRAWERGLEELARVTRRGGTLVFDILNGWSPWVRWHEWYARTRRRLTGRRRELHTYAASPRRVRQVLTRRSFDAIDVEGYFAVLPMVLPPFGRLGQLATRSNHLSFGLAASAWRWTGHKLLFSGRRT